MSTKSARLELATSLTFVLMHTHTLGANMQMHIILVIKFIIIDLEKKLEEDDRPYSPL